MPGLVEVRAAREVIRRYLPATPLIEYPALGETVGCGIRVLVKHENHLPTAAFKVRNALAALSGLDRDARARGVVAASTGNFGAGLAWAGRSLGIPVTVCVPRRNNPEKNAAIRGLGATLVKEGDDYHASTCVAARLARLGRLTLLHSTNDPGAVAGAATLTLEVLDQASDVDTMVLPVGGGSLAGGALTVARELRPGLAVYGVQAKGASAVHDSWHSRTPIAGGAVDTFADGIVNRQPTPLTFPTLLEGLTGFLTVTESEIAEALRLMLRTTHNLCEGAAAAGLAGLLRIRDELAGSTVALVLSGANIEATVLRRLLNHEI